MFKPFTLCASAFLSIKWGPMGSQRLLLTVNVKLSPCSYLRAPELYSRKFKVKWVNTCDCDGQVLPSTCCLSQELPSNPGSKSAWFLPLSKWTRKEPGWFFRERGHLVLSKVLSRLLWSCVKTMLVAWCSEFGPGKPWLVGPLPRLHHNASSCLQKIVFWHSCHSLGCSHPTFLDRLLPPPLSLSLPLSPLQPGRWPCHKISLLREWLGNSECIFRCSRPGLLASLTPGAPGLTTRSPSGMLSRSPRRKAFLFHIPLHTSL